MHRSNERSKPPRENRAATKEGEIMGLQIVFTKELINALANENELVRVSKDSPLFNVYKHFNGKGFFASRILDEEKYFENNKSEHVTCLYEEGSE
jgi:hypothetical protein